MHGLKGAVKAAKSLAGGAHPHFVHLAQGKLVVASGPAYAEAGSAVRGGGAAWATRH